MNIKDTLELISETRSVVIANYKQEYKQNPSNKDLLSYIKTIFKEHRMDEIIDEVFLEETLDCDDLYKLLLIVAAVSTNELD